MVDRPKQFLMRLTEEESAMLRSLAERDGLTASDYLRMFIRRSYAETFGEKKPTKTKK